MIVLSLTTIFKKCETTLLQPETRHQSGTPSATPPQEAGGSTSNVRCAGDREFVYIELVPQRRLGKLLGALGQPLGVPRVARCS